MFKVPWSGLDERDLNPYAALRDLPGRYVRSATVAYIRSASQLGHGIEVEHGHAVFVKCHSCVYPLMPLILRFESVNNLKSRGFASSLGKEISARLHCARTTSSTP